VTAPEPIANRRWYRRTLIGANLAVWCVLVWFFAQSRRWLPGPGPSTSSLLSMTSSACLLMSLAIGRRSWGVAIALMVLATAFLVATIAAVAHGH